MTEHSSTPRPPARRWPQLLRAYRAPQRARAIYELAITGLAFVLCCTLLLLAVQRDLTWLYALMLVPGAGFLVRLFMIQHDCGHGSFFPSRRANDWLGRLLGVLTLTPYYYWQRSHAAHHASSGNLDRRGIGDVQTLTVAEYLARSRWGRIRYRLYRHPAVMFGIGPLYLFVLQNRVPIGFTRAGWRPWLSTIGTSASILGMATAMIAAIGVSSFLSIYVPLVSLGAAAGVWLFYVQHQFEETHWARGEHWSAHDAALYGSSNYQLPKYLHWMTANIGLHHVHHLSSRIPYYRLPEVVHDHDELRELGRVTIADSIRGLGLVLWDEDIQRLVPFEKLCHDGAMTRS